MTEASFTLSAFGDEIDNDLHVQLDHMRALCIGRLDLRGAWGTNVLDLTDEQVAVARTLCDAAGIQVACLGSPIGKTPILEPIEKEQARLHRLFEIGRAVGTRRIRVFSFYPSDTSTNAGYDAYVPLAIERLARLTARAAEADFLLLLENEKEIVTDTPERCHAVLRAIDSPNLRFAWDPANFVQVGVDGPMTRGWEMLKPYVAYVHIKDARRVDGTVTPAGEADGQVRELLLGLREIGYQGVLSIEHHLSGPGGEAIDKATSALRKLMAETGCVESA